MDAASKVIRAAMRGSLTEEEADKALDLAYGVQTHITCPISSRLLDVRTAELLTFTNDQDNTTVTFVAHPDLDITTITGAISEEWRFTDRWTGARDLMMKCGV